VGAPARSKAHTKACIEGKAHWKTEEQEEKQRKTRVRRRPLQLTLFTKEEKAGEVNEGA